MRRAAILVLVVLAVPTAAVADGQGPASFNGSCDFSGAVRFMPAMTTTPRTVAQRANAPGTCTGTFTDRRGRVHRLQSALARYEARSSGDAVSCEFGLAAGSGALLFPYGRVRFTLQEYRPGATPLIRLRGRRAGGAWMPVVPAQSSDPVAALQACGGSGLSEFDLTAHLQTDSPISG